MEIFREFTDRSTSNSSLGWVLGGPQPCSALPGLLGCSFSKSLKLWGHEVSWLWMLGKGERGEVEVLVAFPAALIKHPDRIYWRQTGFILALGSRIQPVMAEKPPQQEREAADHRLTTPLGRGQWVHAHWCSALSVAGFLGPPTLKSWHRDILNYECLALA